MLGLGLIDKIDFHYLKTSVAAGVTTISDAAVVDMAGKDVAVFIIALGAVTAGTVSKVQIHGSDASGSGFAVLTADDEVTVCEFAIADDDDNKLLVIEIIRPQHRYLRPVVVRTTQNVVIENISALTSNVRTIPVPAGTTSRTVKFISPLLLS